jgi:hypothetical protein
MDDERTRHYARGDASALAGGGRQWLSIVGQLAVRLEDGSPALPGGRGGLDSHGPRGWRQSPIGGG